MNSYQAGRNYYFLRTGNVKFILQADQSGTGPAFTWMIFNAGIPSQTGSKKNALNYTEGSNFSETAARVRLGDVEFTALPHNSSIRWITQDSVPAIECTWWAGGVKVTETYAVSDTPGTIVRTVQLKSADLMGSDTVTLKLAGPKGNEIQIPLAPGASAAVKAFIAPELPTDNPKNTPADFAASQYKNLSVIRSSDSLISGLYRSASYALPGMVAANGRMDAGVFEYGNQWVRDGSNVAMGLIYSGAFESARSLLNYILSDLVNDQGTTVVAGGFDEPDREEFDQMGVLMHSLKLYHDWTGDETLLVQYRAKIIAMIERPLNPVFRDATGMVHNRREFWERTFSDAYELAYQTFMIRGLRDAADLAGVLGVPEKAAGWRKEADVFLQAMLHHPSMALVEDGALIKRRNTDGTVADLTTGRQPTYKNDAPVPTEYNHQLNPDATYALPILSGIIDPTSSLARKSLEKLEAIWNARWDCGGYERYHSSSQIDQPGPWTFGTGFIARAQHEAGLYQRSRRSLKWLSDIQGGTSGAWFEEIPLNRSQIPWCGIVPWTSAEVTSFVVEQWLGAKVVGNKLVFNPKIFQGTQKVEVDLRFRDSRVRAEVEQKAKGRRQKGRNWEQVARSR